MTKKISPVICDGCEADITTTGNGEDYRLVLGTESPMPWFVAQGERYGCMTSMAIRPALSETKHFCNSLDCLKAWLEGPEAVAARKARREERNAKINGTCTGYSLR